MLPTGAHQAGILPPQTTGAHHIAGLPQTIAGAHIAGLPQTMNGLPPQPQTGELTQAAGTNSSLPNSLPHSLPNCPLDSLAACLHGCLPNSLPHSLAACLHGCPAQDLHGCPAQLLHGLTKLLVNDLKESIDFLQIILYGLLGELFWVSSGKNLFI